MRRKRRLKKNQRRIPRKRIFIFGLWLVAIYLFIALFVILHQFRPTVETSKSEVAKLPPEIKKHMEKTVVSATSSAYFRVPMLMYHYVEYVKDKKDATRESLNIKPNFFELQVLTLKDAGYTFMTAKELGEVIDEKRTLPEKPVILTFDDGHWDFDTVVLPILKKYQAKATAYIIPGFTNGSDFMSESQIEDVVASGLVDVGAHTVHHISLKDKLFPVVKYEIDASKEMLERRYKIKVVSFAYPNGAFDEQAAKLAKEAGFTTAVSTVPGIEQSDKNRFFLYRLRPGYRIGDELLNYLKQDHF